MIGSKPWWLLGRRDANLATAIWTTIETLRSRRRRTNLDDLTWEAMFSGRPLRSGDSSAWNQYQRSAPAQINVIQSKVNAISSRMSKHRPFPVVTAEDARWREKRFAKATSRVLRTQLGRTSMERDRSMRVRDSIVRGTGVAKVVRTDTNDVTIERVPRSEILFSSREAIYGQPRSLYHIRSYPLEVLQARYPECKKELEAAAQRSAWDAPGWYEWGDDWADDTYQVVVAESWHLPSGYGARDGRHIVSFKGDILSDEQWTRQRFPFAWLHWNPPMRGMLGQGLVEQLAGAQQKINDVSRDIQEALYYGAQLTVFSPRGSRINKEALRARHPKVVEYDGQLPTYLAPLPVSQQLFQYLEWLINWCDDASGLSRDFQSGKTQLGAGASGRAIDTLDDIQSDRFAMFQLHDSLHMVDIGALVIDEAKDIYESVPKKEQPEWIRRHDWDDMDLDCGKYHLKLEPINFLPDTRAGKLSAISEMGQAGLISDPLDLLELMDEPDLARMNRKLLGPRNAISRLIEDLSNEEVDINLLNPDAYFPIDSGIRAVQAEIQDAWADHADEDEESYNVLERYREWLRRAVAKKSELAAAAGPAPNAGPAAPPDAAPVIGDAANQPGPVGMTL